MQEYHCFPNIEEQTKLKNRDPAAAREKNDGISPWILFTHTPTAIISGFKDICVQRQHSKKKPST